MNIIETALPCVLIIEPKVFGDARGYFFESWNQAAYEAAGITKAQGARVCVSTIMPFGCFSEPWRDRAEELRQRCNALIRAGGSWDRLIDLDAVMRDPDNEHLLQAGMDLGDGIHPGPMGGKKIAQTIYREGVAK